MNTTLAQTLNGDWIILRSHTDEADTQTEVARVNTSIAKPGSPARLALEVGVAKLSVNIDVRREGIRVESHQPDHREQMKGLILSSYGILKE